MSSSREKLKANREFIQTVSSWMPKFTDIFDEESFYIFAFCVVILAFVGAFVLSRYVKLEDPDSRKYNKRS